MQQDLSQSQIQELKLSPRLQQSITILELSLAELEEYIDHELEENPMLEEETVSPLEEPEGLSDREERKELEISVPADLQSHLNFQLRLHLDDPEDIRIGEEIISEINEDGYLTTSLEELSHRLGLPQDKVEAVLKVIQTFEPTGVGARNLKECLLLQLRENGHSPLTCQIVENYLGEITSGSGIKKLTKELNCDRGELLQAIKEIRLLEPKPGRLFSVSPPSYIKPDLLLRADGDSFRLEVNTFLPHLILSPSYQNLLSDPEAGEFLKKRVSSAKWVIRCLEKRAETIEKIGYFLLKEQEGFFKGIQVSLKPISLKAAGAALGMHESTISRAIKGKYIDTPKGIFPLKFFFSAGLMIKDSRVTDRHIKEEMRRIIEKESKEEPLSDEEIRLALKEKGIEIARRTVTKYRQSLGIPSKTQRKER